MKTKPFNSKYGHLNQQRGVIGSSDIVFLEKKLKSYWLVGC